MVSKIKRIATVTALSVVVFIATGVLSAWVGGLILGSTTDASGQEKLKGGAVTTLVVLVICAAATIIFAIWLNRILTNYKVSKVKE